MATRNSNYIPWILLALLVFGFLGVGAWLDFPILSAIRERSCTAAYSYVNADAACGNKDIVNKTPYTQTEAELRAFIAAQQEEGKASHVSLYFRDLVRGPAFGINQNDEFTPASLLKLPLAFVYFQSLDSKELLGWTVKIVGEVSREQWIPAKEYAQQGEEYTIEELLRLMLIHSDNSAYNALEDILAQDQERVAERFRVFQEIGFINPLDYSQHSVTTRGYASLFRLLYNVSYLDAQSSEKLLSILAQADYRSGLIAGVPEGVMVAHKFGEREADGIKQLHDCGIIYYPKNPYVLCVMTQGTDYAELQEIIREISRMMYQEVDSRRI